MMVRRSTADGMDAEADLDQSLERQNVATIKHERRLVHSLIDGLVVVLSELVPLYSRRLARVSQPCLMVTRSSTSAIPR